MTITEPSQYSDKDPSQSAWEKQVTEATNRIQHQIDNINESVNTSESLVAIYSKTQDGAVQQLTPFADGDGFVAYVAYTDSLPTLPVTGATFSAYSDEEISIIIKQYRETATRPTNPGTTSYQVSGGVWTSSSSWTKTKLNRAGINVWFCEAKIVGLAGQTVTAQWSNPKLLYGGAVASGILYYNVAQTSAPSAPPLGSSGAVIDGYDYDSGVFSLANNADLSTIGWQYLPITTAMGGGTTISHKHWQVTFHVETAESTLPDGTTPGQIITFGTVEGFIPIGSNLQSDTYSAGSAGWKIERATGNAEFNNITARGNITAESITSGTLNAARIAATALNADNISAGNLNADILSGGTINGVALNISGLTSLTGTINAPNLNVGVILKVNAGNVGFGNAFSFTTTNESTFDTDIILLSTATANQGTNSAASGNITVRVIIGGAVTSLVGVAVGGSSGTGSRALVDARKIQVGKGVSVVVNGAGGVNSNDPASVIGSCIALEVRRV